jgi:hypothetical protein
MNRTIRLVADLEDEDVRTDCTTGGEVIDCRSWQDEIRWTTRQVIAACLWTALFGLGCGYAWLLLQIGTRTCR